MVCNRVVAGGEGMMILLFYTYSNGFAGWLSREALS